MIFESNGRKGTMDVLLNYLINRTDRINLSKQVINKFYPWKLNNNNEQTYDKKQ